MVDTSTCNTVEDIAVRMQHAKSHEENDPINKEVDSETSIDEMDQEFECGTSSEVMTIEQQSIKINVPGSKFI